MRYAQAGGFALHTLPLIEKPGSRSLLSAARRPRCTKMLCSMVLSEAQRLPLALNEQFERLSPLSAVEITDAALITSSFYRRSLSSTGTGAPAS